MKVVGPTAICALFVKISKFFEDVVPKGSVFVGVEHLVIVGRRDAYLSKIDPFVLERFCPSLDILFKSSFAYLRVVHEIAVNKGYLLVGHILVLNVAQNIVVKLRVKAEEHLGVV